MAKMVSGNLAKVAKIPRWPSGKVAKYAKRPAYLERAS